MSIGSLGIIGGVAGSQVSQVRSDADRVRATTDAQARAIDSQQQAEDAAGIGRTDGENHESHDRDADGRRFWEAPPEPKDELSVEGSNVEAEGNPIPPTKAVDSSGQSGGQLDLTG
ncbi:MAG: hypothetical protein QM775_24695 [Pirellulales bacterium]